MLEFEDICVCGVPQDVHCAECMGKSGRRDWGVNLGRSGGSWQLPSPWKLGLGCRECKSN